MNVKVIAAVLGVVLVIIIGIVASCGGSSVKVTVSEKILSDSTDISNLTVNVYMENSGSMDGYMCDGSDLKDAVFDYVSELNCVSSHTGLYYINSQPIPFSGSLNDYIKTLNPVSFKAAGGNRKNSDLAKMLSTTLDAVNDSTVCIFVSDCILDLPVADSQKFLNNCRISVKNAVNQCRQRVPDLAVEIIQLKSNFTGMYYYPDNKSEKITDVERPYYIWIFGKASNLAKINAVAPLSVLENYKFQGSVVFTGAIPVPYSISNSFTPNSNTLKAINGTYTMILRVNFSTTLQPAEVIEDASNYSFHKHGFTVESVTPITDKSSQFTHSIIFSVPEGSAMGEDILCLNAPQSLPQWVQDSNDESGTDITNKLGSTTGILQLIQGVADSYKNVTEITNCKFKISKS